jgi:hypothetical protein
MLKSYVLAPISAAVVVFALVAVVYFSGISGIVGTPAVEELTALPGSRVSFSLEFGEKKLPMTLDADIAGHQIVNRAAKGDRLTQKTASSPTQFKTPFYRGPYTFSDSRIL